VRKIRSLSENRNRYEEKLGLGLFFGFLRRIAPLFADKKRKIAQIQVFWNKFSVLGQAPSDVLPQYNELKINQIYRLKLIIQIK